LTANVRVPGSCADASSLDVGTENPNIGAPGSFADASSPDVGGFAGNLDRRTLGGT
jgi:hypothetical protein